MRLLVPPALQVICLGCFWTVGLAHKIASGISDGFPALARVQRPTSRHQHAGWSLLCRWLILTAARREDEDG